MTLLYTYALTRPAPAGRPDWDRLAGVGGAPVRPVDLDAGVTAVVSPVPEQDFDEAALRARLEDLAWLEQTARIHDAVVQEIAHHGPVLPLRLATLYRDAGSLRTAIAAWPELPRRLDDLTDAQEWGVKIDLRSPAAAERPAPAAEDGRAYLRRRQAQRLGGQAREAAAADWGRRLPGELAGTVTATRELAPQNRSLNPHSGGVNIVNLAFLVPGERRDQFHARLDAIAAQLPEGVALHRTGPWAPYNFATVP